MKTNRILVMILTAVLALSAAGMFLLLGQEEPVLFHVSVRTDAGQERISYWENTPGEYRVFLPGYADLSRATLELNTETALTLDGEPLLDGTPCDRFVLNRPYALEYTVFGETRQATVTFLQSAGVATLYLDTQSGSMELIHKKKGNEESGALRLYGADGTVNYSGEVSSFNGRGNSSWARYDKKAYSVTLLNEADLLGMGAANKWILLANADDRSNMRNRIISDFAAGLGMPCTPESQWVDLYLNGEYTGLYQLSERNEVHANRVDIAHGDSFLVSMEWNSNLTGQGIPAVTTESGKMLRIHYSRDLSDDTVAGMTDILNAVENALEAPDGIDPVSGKRWDELIDVRSWVCKYLVEEVFGNIDAGRISQFFYFDGRNTAGKLYAGPVWDYDHAIGNRSEWQLLSAQALLADRPEIEEGYYNSWYRLLADKAEFTAEVAKIYQEECRPLLQELPAWVEGYYQEILTASRMDEARWPNHPREITDEKDYILRYMEERMAFFDRLWVAREEYHVVNAVNPGDYNAFYAVFDGECLTDLPDFADRTDPAFLGWYYEDSGEPFDPAHPITEDTAVYAKWETVAEPDGVSLTTVLQLVPPGVMAVLVLVLLTAEFRRAKRSR